jgi:hypothetical protein
VSLFYISFTCEYTHEVSAVPPDSPCMSAENSLLKELHIVAIVYHMQINLSIYVNLCLFDSSISDT